MNENEPSMKCREIVSTVKTIHSRMLWEEYSNNLSMAMWQSSLRWHDFYSGFYMELGNLNMNAGLFINFPPVEWGKDKGKHRSTDVIFRDGLSRSSEEVSVMEMKRRTQVIQVNFFLTTRKRGGLK